MAELKTKPTSQDAAAFINGISAPELKKDCNTLLQLMKKATGEKPVLWNNSIVGFGMYEYKNKSGKGGRWFITGFSPRKQNLTIYIMPGFERYNELMAQLGKYKTGVSCLYVNSLAAVDMEVLRQLVQQSYTYMKQQYGKA
jgi:Domain of unknown function (DU1801)